MHAISKICYTIVVSYLSIFQTQQNIVLSKKFIIEDCFRKLFLLFHKFGILVTLLYFQFTWKANCWNLKSGTNFLIKFTSTSLKKSNFISKLIYRNFILKKISFSAKMATLTSCKVKQNVFTTYFVFFLHRFVIKA